MPAALGTLNPLMPAISPLRREIAAFLAPLAASPGMQATRAASGPSAEDNPSGAPAERPLASAVASPRPRGDDDLLCSFEVDDVLDRHEIHRRR